MNQKSKKIIFDKQFEREMPLFDCVTWDEADRLGIKPWLGQGLKNILFIKKPKNQLMSVWYDRAELDYFDKLLKDKVLGDVNFFSKIKKAFIKYWQPLIPYANGKKIETLAEFKKFYKAFQSWWPLMSIIYWIPATDAVTIKGRAVEQAKRLRTITEKFSDYSEFLYLDFFKQHYPQYQSYRDVITPNEFFSLAKKPFSKKQLQIFKKRKDKGYIYLEGKLQSLQRIKKLQFKTFLKNSSQLTGQIAYRGKVIGKVRLVNLTQEVTLIKRGEILVAHMTNPRYLSAIQKSSAIITDEGGITCHAAITARELKKPCIIGTKIATEVLKTGDRVEVDAHAGIIKIFN